MNEIQAQFDDKMLKLKEMLKDLKLTGFFIVGTVETPSGRSAYTYHASDDYMSLIGFVDTFSIGMKETIYSSIIESEEKAKAYIDKNISIPKSRLN